MDSISLNEKYDIFTWDGGSVQGHILVEEAYRYITPPPQHSMSSRWFRKMWGWNIPLKLKCFDWLVWKNKWSMWDNLCLMGFSNPSICILCGSDIKDVAHFFLKCYFTISIWFGVMHILNIYANWNSSSLESCLQDWTYYCKEYYTLPLYFI